MTDQEIPVHQTRDQVALIDAKSAAKTLRSSPAAVRNQVLHDLSELLLLREQAILEANARDLAALPTSTAAAFRDRLLLNAMRLQAMRESLLQVAALPDPLNEIVEERMLANGLKTKRVRSPLGVLLMIFESRPNVAIEAFSLALKSGNVILLRGGKESIHTVTVFYQFMKECLTKNELSEACMLGITDPDRGLLMELLQERRYIDVVIPRGGDQLIEFVVQNSRIPIIKNDRGMCHLYVHSDADLAQTLAIIENAKKQRPGVCNAVETLLIHEKVKEQFLPKIYERLTDGNPVEWYACESTLAVLGKLPHLHPTSAESFDTEYLDLKLNCRVVDSIDTAIEHIEQHGSKHSEAIITQSEVNARKFQNEVDAAAVYWNASTRFTDGFELGLGGELGISTQKLHVRGPVGLRELTSIRWIMDGQGQVRE